VIFREPEFAPENSLDDIIDLADEVLRIS